MFIFTSGEVTRNWKGTRLEPRNDRYRNQNRNLKCIENDLQKQFTNLILYITIILQNINYLNICNGQPIIYMVQIKASFKIVRLNLCIIVMRFSKKKILQFPTKAIHSKPNKTIYVQFGIVKSPFCGSDQFHFIIIFKPFGDMNVLGLVICPTINHIFCIFNNELVYLYIKLTIVYSDFKRDKTFRESSVINK